MPKTLTPFLAFDGKGREALGFYKDVFPDAEVVRVVPFGPDEEGPEGMLRLSELRIGATGLRIIDIAGAGFAFSPAMSVFTECGSPAEVDQIAARLMEEGQALMPPDSYPFAQRFAWVQDKFGVNWQLIFGEQEIG